MYTRKQYMNKECTHREFYGQHMTLPIINMVVRAIGKDRLLRSTDEHLNDIPLKEWDNLHPLLGGSLSDSVCFAKEAARQWLELNNS